MFSVTQIVQFVRTAAGNHPGSSRCLILAGEPATPRDLKTTHQTHLGTLSPKMEKEVYMAPLPIFPPNREGNS